MVAKKKDNKDDKGDQQKFLGTGAAGDPENPEAGAPGTQFAVPVVEVEQPKPSAKDDK